MPKRQCLGRPSAFRPQTCFPRKPADRIPLRWQSPSGAELAKFRAGGQPTERSCTIVVIT